MSTSHFRIRRLFEGPGLVLLALATAVFPRVVTAIGFPAVLNFAHFAVVLLVYGYTLTQERTPVYTSLTLGVYSFFVVIIVSALVNKAGMANAILELLLLTEPFLLLAIISNARWSSEQIGTFRRWIFLFVVAHALMAYGQYVVLGLRDDYVKGVFLEQGAGHHVAGAVALSAALYFYVDPPLRSKWFAVAVALFFAAVTIFSDTKQVIAVFLGVAVLLATYKQFVGTESRKQGGYYLLGTVAGVGVLIWASVTIFPALRTWADPELIQAGLRQKFSVFSILSAHFHSALNWLFGLGPGHTVGRLGLLMPDYWTYLHPLDATLHPATQEIVYANENHWISNSTTGSSMWALTFSYAGLLGDLGIVGLGMYLYLWWIVWKRLCHDDAAKFLLLTVLALGVVFAWLEEPGYMLFIVSLIGLRHLEQQAASQRSTSDMLERVLARLHAWYPFQDRPSRR